MTKKATIYLLGANDYPNVPPIHLDGMAGLDKLVETIRERHPAWDAERVALAAVMRTGAVYLANALKNPHADLTEDGALVTPRRQTKPAGGHARGEAAAARLRTELAQR